MASPVHFPLCGNAFVCARTQEEKKRWTPKRSGQRKKWTTTENLWTKPGTCVATQKLHNINIGSDKHNLVEIEKCAKSRTKYAVRWCIVCDSNDGTNANVGNGMKETYTNKWISLQREMQTIKMHVVSMLLLLLPFFMTFFRSFAAVVPFNVLFSVFVRGFHSLFYPFSEAKTRTEYELKSVSGTVDYLRSSSSSIVVCFLWPLLRIQPVHHTRLIRLGFQLPLKSTRDHFPDELVGACTHAMHRRPKLTTAAHKLSHGGASGTKCSRKKRKSRWKSLQSRKRIKNQAKTRSSSVSAISLWIRWPMAGCRECVFLRVLCVCPSAATGHWRKTKPIVNSDEKFTTLKAFRLAFGLLPSTVHRHRVCGHNRVIWNGENGVEWWAWACAARNITFVCKFIFSIFESAHRDAGRHWWLRFFENVPLLFVSV